MSAPPERDGGTRAHQPPFDPPRCKARLAAMDGVTPAYQCDGPAQHSGRHEHFEPSDGKTHRWDDNRSMAEQPTPPMSAPMLDAGRLLDAEIAERVMGDVRLDQPVDVGASNRPRLMFWKSRGELMRNPPDYSTDIATAWTVVEKLRERGWDLTFGANRDGPGWWVVGSRDDCDDVLEESVATFPLLICHAALWCSARSAAPQGDGI